MDEKQFFERFDERFQEVDMLINGKFESVGLLLGDLIDKVDEIVDWIATRKVVEKTLADFSKEPKAKRQYDKPMPKKIGDWIIAKKGCNSCNGNITWDNYNKETHPYPDHVNERGELVDCPDYVPREEV